jgi:hypothetical protein
VAREVDEATVHQAISKDDAGILSWDAGKTMVHHEVASLIVSGDRVFVIVEDDGAYRHADEVRVKPGQHEYLESFGDDGAATAALLALQTYQ